MPAVSEKTLFQSLLKKNYQSNNSVFLGENPDRVYDQSRMDAQWNFRQAYNEAKKVKDEQDAICQKVEAEQWDSLCDEDKFPESLEWESLVDVLRGKVKVSYYASFCTFRDLLLIEKLAKS